MTEDLERVRYAIIKNAELFKRLVDEALNENATLPRAQKIVDWRQMFFTRDRHIASHHFPLMPRKGELWQVPISEYDAKGEKVTVRIVDVLYEWRGLEYENGVLYGWHLDVKVLCEEEEPFSRQ